jgi:hypothetical protein
MLATSAAAGVLVLVVTILIFVELVSLAHVYKNVNRFFFTKITYTVGSATAQVSKTQDSYQVFGIPFSASLVTVSASAPYSVILTLDKASPYTFVGATIDAQTENGGFVSVDKSLANNLIMIPYELNANSFPTLQSGTITIDLRITWDKKASR